MLPHYRVPVFHALNEWLQGRLVVCHGAPPKGGYLAATVGNAVSSRPLGFRRIELGNRWWAGDRLVWQRIHRPFRACGTPAAVISEGGPRQISLPLLLAYTRTAGIPLILWNHAGSRRREVSSSYDPRDLVHRWLHRRVDAFLCYTERERDLLAGYCDPSKLFVARNTVAASALFRIRQKLEKQGQISVRVRLGLPPGRVQLLFLGSLVSEKRAAEAIEATAFLRNAGTDVGLLVVGDGPERQGLERSAVERRIPVRFAGTVDEDERLAEHLFAADLLLLPGAVGLAVNQALALGLPVVTRRTGPNGPFHGPEIDHVCDHETGRQVTEGGVVGLASAIDEVLQERDRYATNSVAYAEAHLHERWMIEQIARALEYVGVSIPMRSC